jgi:hypothetical protein
MSYFWMFTAIALGLIALGLAATYMRGMKLRGRMRDILLLGLVPALAVVAVLEFVVVPTWGVEAAASLAPVSCVCIILPASMLANRTRKYRKAE